MFFLLRAAFWLSVVIMFLPADPDSHTEAPRVSAIDTLVAARAAITDMSQFCDRNPDVCVTGNAALKVFAEKAQYGARMLYEYLDRPKTADAARGTLTPDDRAPEWRGHPAA
jgi:hypothetical protein